ncbi:MAG: DNA internalization-related competence protein ComEC/Rec2, partial [Candidatus Sulfomarinibacteraceae bacterium]
ALIAGLACFLAALLRPPGPTVLWLSAGLLMAGGHGLLQTTDRLELDRLIGAEEPLWIRARLVVTEGWSHGRWGWRAPVSVLESSHESETVPALRRCRLEIRGNLRPGDLPPPGTVIRALVSIRGSPSAPLLVASSHRLIEPAGGRGLQASLRDNLAGRLLASAGTDVRRIRAAELAAALALGRRDLVPESRRDGWRRSGLAHVLAVSGLHVGLVAGMTWLIFALAGASLTTSRIAVLLVLPTYALLAGGSPSAVRAALMGCVYVGARLLGRAVLPMAAVLLAATILLIADPSLIAEVSFQLTIVLTAALVRWAPALSAALPLPRWLSAALVVPVIAQVAAAPIVAVHFATAVPGAAAANLLVPWLLGPLVLTSVAATVIAPLSTSFAGLVLDGASLAGSALWLAGAPGRLVELVPPPVPPVLLVAFVLFGAVGLLPVRRARLGAAAYLGCVVAGGVWWLAVPPSRATEVELLPVSHGLAVRVSSAGVHLLMDGGGLRRETAEMLAPSRIRRLDLVIASHGDEDHIGGLETVLRTTSVDELVLPAWLTRAPEAVPLIRAARRRGVRVRPVVRGSRIDLGPSALEILWPAADPEPDADNERSLVARLALDRHVVLLTADIGRSVETILAATSPLDATILIVPHHGSRYSASAGFLDAVSPGFALIPAGPENTHNHPHHEVVDRLEVRGIRYRMPIRDGRCGARLKKHGEWVLYPPLESPEGP